MDWPEEFLEGCTKAVECYYSGRLPGPFTTWFRRLHLSPGEDTRQLRVLLLLVFARFSQFTKAEMALDNTDAVYGAGLLGRDDVPIEDVPALKGTRKAKPEPWRKRFHEALPALRDLSALIASRRNWGACELYAAMEVAGVPDLGAKTSRLAVRCIRELLSGEITVDMGSALVPVDVHVYRVASRMRVVDPTTEPYTGRGSPGDRAIQRFARRLFPGDPTRIDEPFWMMGRQYCHPKSPECCGGCIFRSVCPSAPPISAEASRPLTQGAEGSIRAPAVGLNSTVSEPQRGQGVLVIVSCVGQKEWDLNAAAPKTVPAGRAYCSALFKKSRTYAEKVGEAWCVFSAKYGFVLPDEGIEDYDVTFKLRSRDCVQVDQLKAQIRDKGLARYRRRVVLGGCEYVQRAREAFASFGLSVEDPLAGLTIGKRLQWLDKCLRAVG